MNSRKVAVVGIFGALAFLLTFIEFPIIPLLPFLKFDPSDCMVFLVTLIYGFLPGLFTLLIKNFLFIFRSGEGLSIIFC
jgi:riboflavin transporter FmnP